MAGTAGTYNSPARIAQTMGIAAYRSALGGFLDRDRRLPPPQPQRLTHGWKSDDPEAWIAGELGGHVHGLDSIFDEAQKRNLPQPQSIDKLHEHLRVEGDADFIRLGEHALRVRADDDEVESAADLPERRAFLLHDSSPCPPLAA